MSILDRFSRICKHCTCTRTSPTLAPDGYVSKEETNGGAQKKKLEEIEEGSISDGGDGRTKWSSSTEFMLTCIGYSVGLGNVWRFPYLCYKNGGGAFLIPYMVMIFLIGMPLLFMEYSFGQYFGIGSLSIFKKVCPLFQGIGIGYAVLNALVCIYYNVIIAMALYYIFGSFTTNLPWATCGNPWNTPNCDDNENSNYANCTGSAGGNWNQTSVDSINFSYNNSSLAYFSNISSASNCSTTRSSPTEEYFRYALLGETPDINIGNLGGIQWHLCLCLLLSWILVILFVSRGIQSTGKVAYFTATFPYVMLTVLVVRGATLPGASKGILYFVTPDWTKLASPDVWFQAATQLFYSTNLAWGGMITMASYNPFKHNCHRDAIVINLISYCTSLYAGIAVFSIIGYMANEYGVPVDKVISSGPGLAFIAYPRALSLMPLAPMWTALFFFMLFLLGIGSQMVLIETVVTGFVDEFPRLGLNGCIRFTTTLTICIIFFISGIAMTTKGGMYILQLMDHYSAGFCVLVIAVIECVAINWVYGIGRMSANIKEMLDFYPHIWWRSCWLFISPMLIVGILIFSFIKYRPVEYNGFLYPIWADVLGWCLSLASNVPIVIVAIFVVYYAKGSGILEKLRNATRPAIESKKAAASIEVNEGACLSNSQNNVNSVEVDSSDNNCFASQAALMTKLNNHHHHHLAQPHQHLQLIPLVTVDSSDEVSKL